jgi:hypothetical protein
MKRCARCSDEHSASEDGHLRERNWVVVEEGPDDAEQEARNDDSDSDDNNAVIHPWILGT